MIKILFFIDSLTGGGAEKVLQNLVNSMDQHTFQITLQTVEHTAPESYLVPGIRYKAIYRAKTSLGKALMSYWIRLCAELKWIYPLYIKDNYDIEVAFLEAGPTKFLSSSTNQNALKLSWVHCDLKKKGVPATDKLQAIYRAYDKVICVSDNVKQAFQQLLGEFPPCEVLYNVTDETDIIQKAKAFPVESGDCFTFLSVGRLVHQKGYDRLLEACRILKEDGYSFRLLILGEGPERPALEMQIQTLELQSQVHLHGFAENPYPHMAAADCIVCASRYEGFSTVITEALILGKPIVTTPCAGMEELLGNGEFGMITEDSVSGLCTAMKDMMDKPALCACYAAAAQRRGKTFSKSMHLTQIERFFQEELQIKRSNL